MTGGKQTTSAPLAHSLANGAQNVLETRNVVKSFASSRRIRAGEADRVTVVDDVSLQIPVGRTLGLVGESGCGKSTLARLITGILEADSGSIQIAGEEIVGARTRSRLERCRAVQMVFQDPFSSLNPRRTVGSILSEPLVVHGVASGEPMRRQVYDLMEAVGLSREHYHRHPSEFSGGQRQRIGIARALALRPKLIVCDEPVSALDVSIQAQILNLLQDLQADFGLTYLFISHDLSVIRHVSDEVAVMYMGQIVEQGPVEDVCTRPRHPYTATLMSTVPHVGVPGREHSHRRIVLAGEVPSLSKPPTGCRFHPRCPKSQDLCREAAPALEPTVEPDASQLAACHFPISMDQDLAEAVWEKEVALAESEQPEVDGDGAVSDDPQRVEPEVSGADIAATSPLRAGWRALTRDRLALCALVIVAMLVVVGVFAPWLAGLTGHPSNTQYPKIGLTPDGSPVGPSSAFLLGTDELGRDVLSRIIAGTRVSLGIGVGATALALVVGLLVGLCAGYFGGVVDVVSSRVIDVLLSFPLLLFALALVARFGSSVLLTLIIVALVSWPPVARLVRGQVLSLRKREFIEAARSIGSSHWRILVRDLLPNLFALTVVYATLQIPTNIIWTATLSYLGLGVRAPAASWGNMISEAQSANLFTIAPWLLVAPCVVLTVTAVAFNLVGDGLRDALDPSARRFGRW